MSERDISSLDPAAALARLARIREALKAKQLPETADLSAHVEALGLIVAGDVSADDALGIAGRIDFASRDAIVATAADRLLAEAADKISGETGKADQLAAMLGRYFRGRWRRDRHAPCPPEYAGTLDECFFYWLKLRPRPIGGAAIEKILRQQRRSIFRKTFFDFPRRGGDAASKSKEAK